MALILFGGGAVIAFEMMLVLVHPPPISTRLIVLAAGLLVIAMGVSCIVFPAKVVDRFADGSFTFTTFRRSLDVAPGELVRVVAFPMDLNRLLPMRVRARRGGIWLTPQLTGIRELFNDLAAQNPLAYIDAPRLSSPFRSSRPGRF
ncbi:MAG TPA: hypothetical protein VNV87_08850 [Acidimicrobiales bacterium]|nr:hypothetical protein [Acidimicrobiales bacterium]